MPRWWTWAALALILAGVAAIRLRLLDIPLDRDEGEYAYMGRLLLDGVPPYVGAYNMKMPGTYAVYAVILALFGTSPAAIRTALLLANAGAIVLMFLVARRIAGRAGAVVAAMTLGGLTLSPRVLGFAAYAEQFMLVPVLGGVLLLLRALAAETALASRTPARGANRALFAAGLLFGLAFLLKQSGALFVTFALVWTLVQLIRTSAARREVALTVTALAAGAVVPFALVCVAFAATGALPNFWFWTFSYASEYVSTVPLLHGMANLAHSGRDILPSALLAVAASAVGFAGIGMRVAAPGCRAFAGLFAIFSFLAITPGLYFRHHYYVLFLPALALGASLAPATAWNVLRARPRVAAAVACAFAVLPAAGSVWAERVLLLDAPPARIARTIYAGNPFPESVPIAAYIKRHTTSDDRIVVIGSEPQIYFYAERRAATGYIYMYPLMEQHPFAARMQQQMIREIEASNPKFLVFVNVSSSWLAKRDSDLTLSRWLAEYGRRFDRVGVVEILSADTTRYTWDDAARDHAPESQRWLAVLRRRADR